MDELKDILNNFWRTRQDLVYLCENEECKKAYTDFLIGIEEFNKLYPDEMQLLITIIDRKTDLDVCRNNLFYKQGFKDGLKMVLSL